MIKKIFSTLFKSTKKATEGVGKSMDFIDDVLEKEYITGAVENVKEASGKVVEKAGTIYQKTKDAVDENLNPDNLKDNIEKMVEKGKEATSDLAETMLEKSGTLKNVMEEGKEMIKDIIDGKSEEE